MEEGEGPLVVVKLWAEKNIQQGWSDILESVNKGDSLIMGKSDYGEGENPCN